MKRKIFSILFALMLVLSFSLVTAAPAAAHTVSDPQVTPLIAGQNINVGTVKTWNDGTNLYVRYDTTVGWKLAETHLAVATSLADIPQTKTSNPIPGQFAYTTTHNPWVTTYTYQIPLSWGVDIQLYIAAHAKVKQLSGVVTGSLASGATGTVAVAAEDPLNLGNPGPYGAPGPAVLTWVPSLLAHNRRGAVDIQRLLCGKPDCG